MTDRMQERREQQGQGNEGSRKLAVYKYTSREMQSHVLGAPLERKDLPLCPWTYSLY